MSAQARYMTILKNTTSIYAANSENRTALLHTGLNEIVVGISPTCPNDWSKVRTDSQILLTIWTTKEANSAALEVQNQLMTFLESQISIPSPTLHISETRVDKIHYEYEYDDVHEKIHKVGFPPVVVVEKEDDERLPQDEEEEADDDAEVDDEVAEAEADDAEVDDEVEADEVDADEAEAEAEADEAEADAEAEEEEDDDGVEVNLITIRNRKYWLDSDNKLYANAEGDEVGEEVGAMINGKPVFLN